MSYQDAPIVSVSLEAVGLMNECEPLLDDVSFKVNPRELIAIIGPSGAGKTTLLHALNGYQRPTRGHVYFNGFDVYENAEAFHSLIGYVPQKDVVHMHMTVESELWCSARWRLPPQVSDGDITASVKRTLEELKIAHRAGVLTNKISGGQLRRVNIGMELLIRPSLLFLDEPTKGLDPDSKSDIMTILRRHADAGGTVVVVCHPDLIEDLAIYDKVVVMAPGGVLSYFGPPSRLLSHFQSADLKSVFGSLEAKDNLKPWPQGGRSKDEASPRPSYRLEVPRAWPELQFNVFRKRLLQSMWNSKSTLAYSILLSPCLAALIAIIFQPNIFASVQSPGNHGKLPIQDGPGFVFSLLLCTMITGLFMSCTQLVQEKDIYTRERHVGLLDVPYLVSKIAVLGLLALAQCIVVLLIVGTKVDFGLKCGSIVCLLLLLFLSAFDSIILGLILSRYSKTSEDAIKLSGAILLVQLLFSGLFATEDMPLVCQWLADVCISRWVYGGLCGLLNISGHLESVGLGSQVQNAYHTSVSGSIGILISFAIILIAFLRRSISKSEKLRSGETFRSKYVGREALILLSGVLFFGCILGLRGSTQPPLRTLLRNRSAYTRKVSVPHFAGLSMNHALNVANQRGLALAIKRQPSANITASRVMTQSSPPATLVTPKTVITLVVSTGSAKRGARARISQNRQPTARNNDVRQHQTAGKQVRRANAPPTSHAIRPFTLATAHLATPHKQALRSERRETRAAVFEPASSARRRVNQEVAVSRPVANVTRKEGKRSQRKNQNISHAAMIHCPHCGRLVDADAKFCPVCGNRLDD